MVLFQLIYYLSEGLVPPAQRIENLEVKERIMLVDYLFCPKAGIYNYMFDEDLTSLYPSIIMSLKYWKRNIQ